MARPKKRKLQPTHTAVKKIEPKNEKIRFSFELFDGAEREVCAETFPDGYTRKLMERLSAVSQLTENEFRQQGQALRAHTHDWSRTSRPDGFNSLNDQLKDLPGWQFCLSANEHGRIHGIMIDNIFYVIWLDLNHRLYP